MFEYVSDDLFGEEWEILTSIFSERLPREGSRKSNLVLPD